MFGVPGALGGEHGLLVRPPPVGVERRVRFGIRGNGVEVVAGAERCGGEARGVYVLWTVNMSKLR